MATFFGSKNGRGILLAAGLLLLVAIGGRWTMFAMILVVALACMVEIASFVGPESLEDDALAATALQTMIVIIGASASLWLIDRYGPWLTMVVVAAVYCENAAAQIFGKRFGHTRLAPRYSPNKTIEGAFGGWIGGLIGAIIFLALAYLFGGEANTIVFNWPQWVIIAVIAPLVAEIGDWIESRMKRLNGIKDSGELVAKSDSWFARTFGLSMVFGRQGGALDKTDSLWLVSPVALLALMAPWAIGLSIAIAVVGFSLAYAMGRTPAI